MCVNRLIQNYRRTPEKLHAVQIKPPHFSELLMVHFIETLYYFTKLPHLLSCNAMLTNCNSPQLKGITPKSLNSFPFHFILLQFTPLYTNSQILLSGISSFTLAPLMPQKFATLRLQLPHLLRCNETHFDPL